MAIKGTVMRKRVSGQVILPSRTGDDSATHTTSVLGMIGDDVSTEMSVDTPKR
jgi:hypothetical protein